jgi:hypothetical protein
MRRADIEAVSGQRGWYRTTLKPGWAFYVSEAGAVRIGPSLKIVEHWDDKDERLLTVFHACREGIATQDADPLPNALADDAEILYLRAVLAARGDDEDIVDCFGTDYGRVRLEALRAKVHSGRNVGSR